MIFNLSLIDAYGYNLMDGISILGFLLMVFIISFFLFLNWIIAKRMPFFEITEPQELDNYSFSFKVVYCDSAYAVKKHSSLRKIVACLLSIVLIVIPFSELIFTLRFDIYSNWVYWIL